jgi:hypothetical protein
MFLTSAMKSLLERSRYEPRGEVRDLQLERNCDLSTSEKPLHIDIPVKLTEEKVVFSVGALVFEGDLPALYFPPSTRRERPSPNGTRRRRWLRSFTLMRAM